MTWDIDRIVELFSGTLTGSATGSSFPVRHREKAVFLVDVAATSGTDETMVLTIQLSDDDTDWYDAGVIIDEETEGDLTRLTAPTTEAKIVGTGKFKLAIDCCIGKYMRVKAVLGGTDPTFTCTIRAILL